MDLTRARVERPLRVVRHRFVARVEAPLRKPRPFNALASWRGTGSTVTAGTEESRRA